MMHMNPKKKPARMRRKGVAMIEFLLCFTFLVTIMFFIIQYGLELTTIDKLTQLDRDAARWAAMHYADPNFTGNSTTNGSLKYYVLTDLNQSGSSSSTGGTIQSSDIVFPSNYYSPLTAAANFQAGNAITVTLQYDISKKFFFKGWLPGTDANTHVISKSASFVME